MDSLPKQFKDMLDRIIPYSKTLNGTSMQKKWARKCNHALFSSPLVKAHGSARWFLTMAPADLYETRFFEQLLRKDVKPRGAESRDNDVPEEMDLTKDQRIAMMRDHPMLQVIYWRDKSDAVYDCVLNGQAKPLGEIIERTRGNEGQGRGTMHEHDVIAVKHKEGGPVITDATSKDQAKFQKVLDLVDATMTAQLEPLSELYSSDDEVDEGEKKEMRDEGFAVDELCQGCSDGSEDDDEEDEEDKVPPEAQFRPSRKSFFVDRFHPCRGRFDVTFDYRRSAPRDKRARRKFRRLQLANQMHECRQTCWKYDKTRRRCRFMYPRKAIHKTAKRLFKKDKKGRPRLRIEPRRNNVHLNAALDSLLFVSAHGGNHDLQYIDNEYGAVEYTTDYQNKPDSPDNVLMREILAKHMSYLATRETGHTLKDRLCAIATALVCRCASIQRTAAKSYSP